MLRCVLSYFCLSSLLVAQAAGAVAHCSCPQLACQGETRPHFHLNPVACCHHEDGDGAGAADPESEHPSDAIYVDQADAVRLQRFAAPTTPSPSWNLLGMSPGKTCDMLTGPEPVRPWTHGPPFARSCPLYLQQLALLL